MIFLIHHFNFFIFHINTCGNIPIPFYVSWFIVDFVTIYSLGHAGHRVNNVICRFIKEIAFFSL